MSVERLILVGGAARSGTTLLQNMLDCHPDICGAPEFHKLREIINLRTGLQGLIQKGWIDLICSEKEVDQALRRLITDLLVPMAERSGCRFVSEKTPANVFVFSSLAQLLPEAHFIHVVRDPRAVVSSLLEVGKRARLKGLRGSGFTRSVGPATSYVKNALRAGFQASSQFPERVLTVKYEQLVQEPEEETRRICSFLQVEWNEAMLFPGRRSHAGENAQCNDIWYDRKSFNRDPEPAEAEKWKRRLSVVQQALVTAWMRDLPELKELGYGLTLDHAGARLGLRAADWLCRRLPTQGKIGRLARRFASV